MTGDVSAGVCPDPIRTPIGRVAVLLLAVLAGLGAVVGLASPAAAGTVEDENRLYELQNQARAQNGLAGLAYDSAAVGVARKWAQELARSGNLRHNPNLPAEVSAYVTDDWTRLGENVGYASGPDQVFNAYMNSSGHRANILGDYNRVGVGAARDGSGRLWTTVVFIKGPALQNAPQQQPGGFTDISGSVHRDNILAVVDYDLMRGVSSSQFGPTMPMSRAQLATLVRNLLAVAYVPQPSSPPDAFADDEGSVHEPAIDALAALRVVGGNGEAGSSYFPTRNATRSTVASYLGRAYVKITGRALPTGPDAFPDDEGDPAEPEINGLAALDVVGGKADGRFDPTGTVNREQVATMVVQLVAAMS